MTNETAARAVAEIRQRRRARDRRSGLGAVVAALARVVVADPTPTSLRRAFESALLDLVPVRSIHLHDRGAAGPRSSGPRRPDTVDIEWTQGGDGRRIALATRPEPGRRLDSWDLQFLHDAASLGAVVIAFERLARRVLREGPPAGLRFDGAAPLIGSSALMRGLRERIERVAQTSFTVLIEGAIDRQ